MTSQLHAEDAPEDLQRGRTSLWRLPPSMTSQLHAEDTPEALHRGRTSPWRPRPSTQTHQKPSDEAGRVYREVEQTDDVHQSLREEGGDQQHHHRIQHNVMTSSTSSHMTHQRTPLVGQDQSRDRELRDLRPDGRLHQPDDTERGDRAGQGRGEAGEILYSHNAFMLYNRQTVDLATQSKYGKLPVVCVNNQNPKPELCSFFSFPSSSPPSCFFY